MKVDVLSKSGQTTGRSIELPEGVFGVEPNEHAVYLAVKAFNAAQRQGTHKAKEKGEINRTTKKFKRQKGTGGARAGSLKSPLWRGGGRVFGPRPRSYDIDLNKKVKAVARYSAFSSKASKGAVKVVEDFSFDAPKTKEMVGVLQALSAGKKPLVILSDDNANVYLSGRNIPKCEITTASLVNTYQIMNATDIFVFEGAVEKL